ARSSYEGGADRPAVARAGGVATPRVRDPAPGLAWARRAPPAPDVPAGPAGRGAGRGGRPPGPARPDDPEHRTRDRGPGEHGRDRTDRGRADHPTVRRGGGDPGHGGGTPATRPGRDAGGAGAP